MQEVKKKRIAVIGAGMSGLTSIKHCLDEGLDPVCYDERQDLGGVWNYADKVIKGRSSVMRNTLANTCKETYCFSDFPVPDNFPVFLTHERMIEYLRLYAAKFDLERHIHYSHKVVEVRQEDNFSSTGRWRVTFKNEKTDEEGVEIFDGVMVCNGHHSMPNIPQYKGQNVFKGIQIHSNQYRDYKQFEGKRVVVVGFANSGSDIVCELSRYSKQVYLSTYRGSWILGRLAGNGVPFDLQYNRLVLHKVMLKLPAIVRDFLWATLVNARFNHEMFSIEPRHGFDTQNPLISDELPTALLSGKAIVKDGIEHITENGVVFKDGSSVDNIDAIIYATGYEFGFPFIKQKAFEIKNYETDFYQFVFSPEIQPSTLAVIGCIEPFGPIMPASEIQSRWAARVFNGTAKLPSKDKMYEDIKNKHAAIKHFFVDSMRHKIHYDWIEHLSDIAGEIGCKPDIKSMITSDPRLAFALFFGPTLPCHYRLVGPGSWPQARDNILTVWDRLAQPMRTRRVVTGNWRYVGTFLKIFIIFMIFIWIFFL